MRPLGDLYPVPWREAAAAYVPFVKYSRICVAVKPTRGSSRPLAPGPGSRDHPRTAREAARRSAGPDRCCAPHRAARPPYAGGVERGHGRTLRPPAFGSQDANCRRSGLSPAGGDRGVARRRRHCGACAAIQGRRRPRSPQQVRRRGGSVRQCSGHRDGAEERRSDLGAPAADRGRAQELRGRLHRRDEHPGHPLHPPDPQPDWQEVRRHPATGTVRPRGHREDHRHHRSPRPGRGAGLRPQRQGQRQGHRPRLGRYHRQPGERRRRRPVPAAVRRRRGHPPPDHRRYGAGEPAPAAPDPRSRPRRDDPDV